MANIKATALALAIFAAVVPVGAGQTPAAGAQIVLPEGKFAVVKSDLFPEKIAELKQKYDLMETQFKARFDKIEAMAKQLKQIEGELVSKGNSLKAEDLRKLQDDYESLKRRGTRDEADLHDEFSRALEAAVRPVNEKLGTFMKTYAAQRNIVAVFNLQSVVETGMFFFWNSAADITDDFVTEYNKANPVAGDTAKPAPPTGAKPPAKP